MTKEEKEIHKYTLDILYEKNSIEENIRDNIEIKIHSIQKI